MLGGAFGAYVALEMAHALQIRFCEEALYRYAQSILRIEEKSADEITAAVHEFSGGNLAFCSDEEIGAMRRSVYNATFIKDIGRVRDGYLYCTSGRGRLGRPTRLPDPTISYLRRDNGKQLDITPGNELLLAPDSRGTIFVSDGVSLVLNPVFYGQFDAPPMRASWLINDYQHKMIDYAFGSHEPLQGKEVLAGHLVERDGTIYQPLCSGKYQACIVAAESRHDMLAQPRGYYVNFPVTAIEFGTAGALLGVSIASTFLLLYHRQRSFEHRLHRAVRRREITCVYQPIVDLETGEIKAAEALARWTDEMGEAVPPDVFLPVADQRGFLGEITSLVMERVLEELAPLITKEAFHITINIGACDLMDGRFFAHLEHSLQRSGIAPAMLGFEITEHSTALQEESIAAIGRLRAAGHVVYLDDFGTGYSSLSYLHHLHADAIKIDRAFTQTIGTESVTASVVPQILDMASRLGLNVIVEGVETETQAAYFRAACTGGQGQGWLFGRPVPASEFMRLLQGEDAWAPAVSDAVEPVEP